MFKQYYLLEIDDSFNYPSKAVVYIDNNTADDIQSEIQGTLEYEFEIPIFASNDSINSGAIVSVQNINAEVKKIKKHVSQTKCCPRCGSLLVKSIVDGYQFTCPMCYEDFYNFEVNTSDDEFKVKFKTFIQNYFGSEMYPSEYKELICKESL